MQEIAGCLLVPTVHGSCVVPTGREAGSPGLYETATSKVKSAAGSTGLTLSMASTWK